MSTTPNVAILRFTDASPEARPLLSLSVTRHLDQIQKFNQSGRLTITNGTTVTCRMHPDSEVVDPSPAAKLDGARVITGEIVAQFFKHGLAGAGYILTYLVEFSDGSTEPFDCVISVRKFIGLQ